MNTLKNADLDLTAVSVFPLTALPQLQMLFGGETANNTTVVGSESSECNEAEQNGHNYSPMLSGRFSATS